MFFPRITLEGGKSYGGSQLWFAKKHLQDGGCGVIACTDLALTLQSRETGMPDMTKEEYLRLAEKWQKKYFPIRPFKGINGLMLALGMNRLLKAQKLSYRCHWYCPPHKLWNTIRRSLQEGIPVILAIGPAFPLMLSRKHPLPLYQIRGQIFEERCRTLAHYVTITGMDDTFLEVSSWGEKYYIKRREYAFYMTHRSTPLLSSILVLEHKK